MNQPTAEDALMRLRPLVGEWILEAAAPDGEPLPGSGRSSFAWHDSRAHLVQRSSIEAPNAPDAIAIIGCDAANGVYTQLYSDDRGVCRVYQMTIGEGEWTLERRGEPFPQRFVATFADDGNTIVGRWDKAEDGVNFTTDFYLTYRRVT